MWDTIISEDPVWNWHIEYLCNELQEAAERVFRGESRLHDLIINIPPGTTKSTICTVMFPVWMWIRMPAARTICISYSHLLAIDLARRSRDVVLSDKWRRYFPEIQIREDAKAKGNFINNYGGQRFAAGIDGTITGGHAHVIIVDDPLNPKEASSEADRLNADQQIRHTLHTRKVNKKVTFTCMIMQRLHQADPTGMMLKRRTRKHAAAIKHINLPGEVNGNPRKVVRPRKLAKFYKNGLLDPIRLDREVLNESLVEMGQYGYSGQILQDPIPPGGGMFKIQKIEIVGLPPRKRMIRSVRYWDKAGTSEKEAKKGNAHTAGGLLGVDKDNHYWIMGMMRGQWATDDREAVILQTTRVDAKRKQNGKYQVGVEQEPGSGGKDSALATAKNLAGFRVKIDKPSGEKALRADPFSVQVNAGNVSMVPGDWNVELLEELRYFPFSENKDQVDALSGAFKLLTNPRKRVGGPKKHGND